MKICKGVSASPGLVLGQVSRLERHVETFSTGPFDPERELRQLEDAVRTAQSELDCMAERAASTRRASCCKFSKASTSASKSSRVS